MTRRPGRAVAALLALVALAVVPGPGLPRAAAIETDTFGIAPLERTAGRGLRMVVDPGGRSLAHVVVTNRSDAPLRLALRAEPARLASDGTPVLGGDPDPASWIEISSPTILLDAGEARTLAIPVEAPRSFGGRATAAVIARPLTDGPEPAVLQEVGLVVRMTAAAAGSAGQGSSTLPSALAVCAAFAGLAASGIGVRRLARHRAAASFTPA